MAAVARMQTFVKKKKKKTGELWALFVSCCCGRHFSPNIFPKSVHGSTWDLKFTSRAKKKKNRWREWLCSRGSGAEVGRLIRPFGVPRYSALLGPMFSRKYSLSQFPYEVNTVSLPYHTRVRFRIRIRLVLGRQQKVKTNDDSDKPPRLYRSFQRQHVPPHFNRLSLSLIQFEGAGTGLIIIVKKATFCTA